MTTLTPAIQAFIPVLESVAETATRLDRLFPPRLLWLQLRSPVLPCILVLHLRDSAGRAADQHQSVHPTYPPVPVLMEGGSARPHRPRSLVTLWRPLIANSSWGWSVAFFWRIFQKRAFRPVPPAEVTTSSPGCRRSSAGVFVYGQIWRNPGVSLVSRTRLPQGGMAWRS